MMSIKKKPKQGNKRYRRSPEEMIADLQKEIERLKTHAAAKKAKQSPEVKHVVAAVRSLDECLETVRDKALKKTVAEAKELLTSYLKLEGIPLPKKRGPRKKKVADA
jgi:hypothetical protein